MRDALSRRGHRARVHGGMREEKAGDAAILRVLVDGVEVGLVPARGPGAGDELRAHELELELAPLARVLRLEPLAGVHARVQKLALSTRPRLSAGARA